MAPPALGTAAPRLWQTAQTTTDFRQAIAQYYDPCIKAMAAANKKELPKLDVFWRTTLPAALQKRAAAAKDGPYLTKDELVQVMQWKLLRGKMRPLMNLVRSNDASTVERLTREGLAAAGKGDVEGAVTILSGPQLKGIGPATASAILAACSPQVFPFMADEPTMIVFAGGGGGGDKLKYNMAEYLAFQKKVGKKCKEINGKMGGGEALLAEEVGRALWCVSKAESLGLLAKEEAAKKDDNKKRSSAEQDEATSSHKKRKA